MHKDALQMQTEVDNWGAYLFQACLRWVFLWWCTLSIRTGMYLIGKAQAHVVGGHAAKHQKQIGTSSTWINHTGSVHVKCYSRD